MTLKSLNLLKGPILFKADFYLVCFCFLRIIHVSSLSNDPEREKSHPLLLLPASLSRKRVKKNTEFRRSVPCDVTKGTDLYQVSDNPSDMFVLPLSGTWKVQQSSGRSRKLKTEG